MSEFINEDKRKDLKTWIKNFEEVIEGKIIGSSKSNKEIFKKVHEDNDNIRKFFVDDYLNNLTNNLFTKSNKDNHSYKDYFKRENFDFENKYYNLFKKEKEEEKKDKYKGIDTMKDKNQDKNKNYYDHSKYKRKENIIENVNRFTNQPKYEYKSEAYNLNHKSENKNKYDINNITNKYVVYNINNKNENKNANKYDNKYDRNNIKNKYVAYNGNNKNENKKENKHENKHDNKYITNM